MDGGAGVAGDPLRLGIIGAGQLSSSRIYPCLRYLPVRLAAVCDLDRSRAERNAAMFGGARVFTDHAAMLSDADLDAVIVCVGPDQHHRLAIEVMEAGLPVYTEKPPAVTVNDARSMVEASRRTGQICMTGFKKRFAPAYRKLAEAIRAGELGAPSLLSIDYASGFYSEDPDNPRSQFLLDFTVHILDLTRYLFGEVAEVYARKAGPSTYAVSLGFDNGAVGTLALTANRDWGVSTERVEVTGAPGEFASVENSIRMRRYSKKTIVDWHDPSFSTAGGDSLVETGFAGELIEFVAAVREGRAPESSIDSSYRSMVLYDAIDRSARSRDAVRVEAE